MTTPDQFPKRKLLALLLMAIVLAVYAPVLGYPIIDFDANMYLTDNPMVQRGLSVEGFEWAFTTMHFNWHPITWLSHMLDVEMFGLQPYGHHLTSLLLHLANSVLIFSIFVDLTGALWSAFLLAVLFACHPMHVGPVAWLAARKDLLSLFFGLLALKFYLKYVPRRNIGYYFLAVLMLTCSLMSKGTLITFPLLLLLIDYWPLKRFQKENFVTLVNEKLPFVAFAVAGAAINYYAQNTIGAVRDVAMGTRLLNVLYSYLDYLVKAICPANLSIYYPARTTLDISVAALCLALLLGISVLAWRNRARSPAVWFGWLWFLISFAPMIGFVQLGEQAGADRYSYIPYIGLFIAIIWGAREHILPRFGPRLQTSCGTVIVPLTVLVAVVSTSLQLRHWRSSEEIYRYSLSSTHENALIEGNLGAVLGEQGALSEALQHDREAIRIDPKLWRVLKNMGDIYLKQGKLADALAAFEGVIALMPNNERAYNNAGVTLIKMNRKAEAEKYFRRAVELSPQYFEALANLAKTLAGQGKKDEAKKYYQQALTLKPGQERVLRELANLN